MTKPPPACGTPAAYMRHVRAGIHPIDDACIQAYNRAVRRLLGLDDAPVVTTTRADLDDTQLHAALVITGWIENMNDARELLDIVGIIHTELMPSA